ncbi:MAG: YceI family protein [Burkholderiaceae bacterium]
MFSAQAKSHKCAVSLAIAIGFIFSAPAAMADWALDNDGSQLSFVSVKAGQAAEAHHFKKLIGVVGDDGNVNVEIDLSSVETKIDIRNTRMMEMLFEVVKYPAATVSAAVPQDVLADLKAGERRRQKVTFDLSMRGITKKMEAEVLITGAGGSAIAVATTEPIILPAAWFELSAGIEKLREVAGLPSITSAVPVSFDLMFREK